MTDQGTRRRREPRTLLEQLIWERNQTLTEFVEWAEDFARRHNEPGTLSERNLKRLISGRTTDNALPMRPRPTTIRLLERIFDRSINDLLVHPQPPPDEFDEELRRRLEISRRIDSRVISLLHNKLNNIRKIDRQLGATESYKEVISIANQVRNLLSYSFSPSAREKMSTLLSEIEMLAGWQALDSNNKLDAWKHYRQAQVAANESGDAAFECCAIVGHSLVFLELNDHKSAIELIESIPPKGISRTQPSIRSWIAAAYGESLAAKGDKKASLQAFDRADATYTVDSTDEVRPYVALNYTHLLRWRGHALSRLDNPDAATILSSALDLLDPTFVRAKTSLLLDLANATDNCGDHQRANTLAKQAANLARMIGSVRNHNKATSLLKFNHGLRSF